MVYIQHHVRASHIQSITHQLTIPSSSQTTNVFLLLKRKYYCGIFLINQQVSFSWFICSPRPEPHFLFQILKPNLYSCIFCFFDKTAGLNLAVYLQHQFWALHIQNITHEILFKPLTVWPSFYNYLLSSFYNYLFIINIYN